MAKMINRYIARCPYCKQSFAIEGSSPWTRRPIEALQLVETHALHCDKTVIRLRFRAGSRYDDQAARANHAHDIVTADWKLTQVRGTVKPEVKCDGRCTHAKGGDCECSCGGENHGSQL